MIFAPRDAVVIEIVDLDKGNWFYASMARAVGLRYAVAHAQQFSMFDKAVPIIANVSQVLRAMVENIPEMKHHRPKKSYAIDLKHQDDCKQRISLL